jgi:hypothetical protein
MAGDRSQAAPRMTPVMNGGVCAGFLISLGARGIEAFDRNERSLGVFGSPIEAANAVTREAGTACSRCGE